MCVWLYALSALSGLCAESMEAAKYGSAGTEIVETVKYEWHDADRDRDVPVKIYYPKNGDGSFPVIIFSHGLGGSRDGYEYLGQHWASHGYVSVHVQHLGSDTGVWKDAGPLGAMSSMKRAAANPMNAINRAKDITFAIDQIEKMNAADPVLKGRLDLQRIGIAGHSFGAWTTLAAAGLIMPAGKDFSFGDKRVKAIIPMSSPASPRKLDLDHVYSAIKIPCLHMTGTKDSSPIGNSGPEDRRIPFDHMTGVDEYLITFKDGDHMIFSGRTRKNLLGSGEKDAHFQKFIKMSSLAFWDAYLKGDAQAKAWLANGAFEKILGKTGKFEEKRADGNKTSAITETEFRDIDGVSHTLMDKTKSGTVMLFLLRDCPICNSYAPEIARLTTSYTNFNFLLVHPDANTTAEMARRHAKDFALQAPIILDASHELVRKALVSVTPEAAVFSSSGELVYHGRIDDSYAAVGKKRSVVMEHDLRDVLDAVAAKRSVTNQTIAAVGCVIE